MKTLLAIFGLVMLLILAILTGGLGLLFVMVGSETLREAFKQVIDGMIRDALFEDSNG